MLRRGSSNVNSAGDGSEPRSWMSRRGSGASPSSGEGQPGGGGGFGLRRRTSTLATQNVFVKAGKGASNKISPVTPVVFFFDIVFETVENLNALGSAVVIFERGSTLESSEPFKVKDGRADIAFSIAKEMTLYKANADSEQLKEKVYKVAIRSGHKNGKTLGKFRVDLSEYADPLGNERKLKLKMSNGSALVLKIRSKFVHSGKRAKNPDSDSMSQSSAGTYMSSSDIGSDEAYASLDDLDDLDELESDIEFTSASQSHTQSMSSFGSTSVGGASAPGQGMGESNSEANEQFSASRELEKKIKYSREQISLLESENARLKEALAGGSVELEMENEKLRRKIKEMQEIFNHPPGEEEAIADLMEAKMQLASETFALEEAALHVKDLRTKIRSKKKKKSKTSSQDYPSED